MLSLVGLLNGPLTTNGHVQGSTLTLTRSPLESKIDSMESKKSQLTKNTCLIRQVVFYSLESSFGCSNRLKE